MMFREKPITRLYAFAMAAVFAVALAGCGGGGGGSMTTDPGTDPPLSAEEMCVEEKGAGSMLVGGQCYSAAEYAVKMCVDAGGRDNRDGTCTSADDLAAEEEAQKADTAAAATKATAIMTEAGQATDADAGLGGTDAPAAGTVGAYTLAISRDSMDQATVEITVAGNSAADPVVPDKKFTRAMMDLGDERSMHVLEMDADDDGNVVREVVIVKTDIAPATPTPFEDVTDQALNTNPDPDDNTKFRSLTIDENNLSKVSSSEFPSAPLQSAVPFEEDGEYKGMFNGADGTYKCASAGCTLSTDSKGVLNAIAGTWHFTPDAGATSPVADDDYLYYGFWLKNTTDKDDEVTYNEVETFAMAMGVNETDDGNTATGGIGSVVGSAEYVGGTVGVYVKNVTDDQGAIVSATSGHFSADVNLEANFGGGDIGAYHQFVIKGKIDKFTLNNRRGGTDDNDWEVTLNPADFGGRTGEGPGKEVAIPSNAMNTFIGTVTGDMAAGAGSWNGAFYGLAGSGVDHDGDASEANPTPVVHQFPSAVVGEFNANFTNGAVAGGFGAREVVEEE